MQPGVLHLGVFEPLTYSIHTGFTFFALRMTHSGFGDMVVCPVRMASCPAYAPAPALPPYRYLGFETVTSDLMRTPSVPPWRWEFFANLSAFALSCSPTT